MSVLRDMHATLLAAAAEGKIKWIYRNDPLTAIHPLAAKEAEAAECAGAQGKFWAYADALFAEQRRLRSSADTNQELVALAPRANSNPDDLKACLDSRRFAEAIDAAVRDAERLQVSGTPTIFVNGARREGAMSYQDLIALADSRAR